MQRLLDSIDSEDLDDRWARLMAAEGLAAAQTSPKPVRCLLLPA